MRRLRQSRVLKKFWYRRGDGARKLIWAHPSFGGFERRQWSVTKVDAGWQHGKENRTPEYEYALKVVMMTRKKAVDEYEKQKSRPVPVVKEVQKRWQPESGLQSKKENL